MFGRKSDVINKYSVWKSIFIPLWGISDNIEKFLLSGCLFAAILTLLSFVFDQTYLCMFNPEMAKHLPCTDQGYLYVPYLILKLAVLAVFITIWFDWTYGKKVIDEKYIIHGGKTFLRNFVLLLSFIVLNLIPVVSGFLLLFRVPNPVWQIELLYFTFVGIGFVVPFILMRFYALFAVLLNGEGWKNFGLIWHNTSGNGFKIIFSSALLFVLILVLLLSVNATFQKSSAFPPQLYNFFAEFVFNFVTLLMVALVINFMQVQKDQILQED